MESKTILIVSTLYNDRFFLMPMVLLSISLLLLFKCVVMNHASFIDRLQTSEEALFECLTSVEIESILKKTYLISLKT